MIPDSVKQQILDKDIVSVIESEGIQLKRAGADYVCCCPFHKEKTPSFHVSTTRNIFHCFGCGAGGDAITFVMRLKGFTFYEAIEYLAHKHGIQYEKRELTAEEKAAQYKRSRIMDANAIASEWYQKRYAESPGAKAYAKKRFWKDDVLSLFSVGYAPEKGGLYEYMTKLGWKTDAMLEAGLVKRNEDNGSIYDAFRHRIIFPIYSRAGYIAGFSGRYIGDKEGVPKYLNTAETDLFHKGKLLFGWHQAFRQIATTDTAVLVEGSPDVIRLHQIGVKTAVAPCGTSLTDDQISLMATKAKTVIIIGDTDAPGQAAVKRNAEPLVKAGLDVRVMELPEGKDADEYFAAHAHEYDECLARNTYDFIPWICGQMMEGTRSQTEKADVIKKVCSLVAYVRESTTADMYIDSFTKSYKNGKIWQQEYYKAKNKLDREKETQKDDKTEAMLRDYGFYVKDNCYYGAGNNASDRRWSNFVMRPILHIRDEKNARRIFELMNYKKQSAVVKLNQSELVSFNDFKTRIETAGNYIWEAGLPEMTSLKKYLYDDTPSADEIKQLGWQKKYGFYAWGNGGLDEGTFKAADKYGIIDIKGKKYYLPGCALDTRDNTQGYQIQRKFVYVQTNDISLRDYSSRLIKVFGDNAKVALCFLLASLFKDIIVDVTTSFPILNLFGPKGTGKSELGHSLTSFFVAGNIAPNISNTTKAALAEAVAEVSDAVVHLDEYKNNIDLDKREFLKGIWDCAGRSRMNMDNDKKRETTAVDCGVVMSGQEMPTADIALFNRLVFLTFSKSQFSDEEKRHYDELKTIEKRGLAHLTGQLLMLRHKFQGSFRYAWDEALQDLNSKVKRFGMEDRTLRNWAIILAAYKTVEHEVDFPFDYQEILTLFSRLSIDQNNKTKQNNELSGFWDTVDILVSSGKVWIDVDYRIKIGGKPVSLRESGRLFEPNQSKSYLYINFQRISQLYEKEGRESGGKTIPRETLKYYLEHSPEFLGTAKSMRFKLIENASGYVPSNPEQAKTKVTTAMIFDYDAIKEAYSIDIEVGAYQSEESDHGMPPVPSLFENGEEQEDDLPQ